MFSVASAHFADNIIKGIASYVFVYIAIRLSTACIIKKYRGFFILWQFTKISPCRV